MVFVLFQTSNSQVHLLPHTRIDLAQPITLTLASFSLAAFLIGVGSVMAFGLLALAGFGSLGPVAGEFVCELAKHRLTVPQDLLPPRGRRQSVMLRLVVYLRLCRVVA